MSTAPNKIRATYRGGVLEPIEPLPLLEGEEVTVVIESLPDLAKPDATHRFLAAAGSWKDIVDENLADDLQALRRVKTRPEIEPWQ